MAKTRYGLTFTLGGPAEMSLDYGADASRCVAQALDAGTCRVAITRPLLKSLQAAGLAEDRPRNRWGSEVIYFPDFAKAREHVTQFMTKHVTK